MKPKIIALTGGIGSGKSTVAGILRQKGYRTVDCDELSRRAAQLPEVLRSVALLLGDEAVTDGKLNRSYVRARIFNDEQLLCRYNDIFFGQIEALLRAEIDVNEPVVFVEIPVLNAFPFDWDELWLVKSSDEVRIKRATERDGVSAENVRAIMSRQCYDGHFDRVIVNDGSIEELGKTVERLVAAALSK